MLGLTSTELWWVIGGAAGGFVVLLAAALLLTIIALGRRIARQAQEITAGLDAARASTEALFDLAQLNFALERMARGLGQRSSPEPGDEGREGLAGRIARTLRGRKETG